MSGSTLPSTRDAAVDDGAATSKVQKVALIYRVYHLVGHRFRRKRLADFLACFSVTPATRILDVGGTRDFWKGIPAQVTTVNLNSTGDQVADARDLPFADRSFDIVFSNSLIEHVGGWHDQVACAREIARVGIRYYVQTPNQYFPIEPHFLAPFIHWLPVRWRSFFARFTPWALLTRADRTSIHMLISTTRMLTSKQMQELFPDAEISHERFLGLAKSLIATRQ